MQTYPYQIAGEPVMTYVPEDAADLDRFREWFQQANERGPMCLDTETTGLDIYSPGYALRTVQFGDRDSGWVIHWERGGHFVEAARWALHHAKRLRIHNAPFDWCVLDKHSGSETIETLAPRTIDTRLKAGLVDPRQPQEGGRGTGLKPLSAHYLDPEAADTQGDLTAVFRSLGLTKSTGWAGIPLDHPTYNLYAGLDVILGSRIDEALDAELAKLGVRPKLIAYEHELARICAVMQRRGMVLDIPYTRSMRDRLMNEEGEAKAVALSYSLDSVNAPAQVVAALSAMGETFSEVTDSGNPRADKAVLLAMADLDTNWKRIGRREPNPLADAILRAKRAGKWRTAYADTFLETVDEGGRIHPFINSMQARTGRMSITRPALQTLPSGDAMIRNSMLADGGEVIVSCDFQAVEMRVLAALADVSKMKQALNAGEDLHGFTASLIFGADYTPKQRKMAKGGGLSKIYGGGVEGTARQIGAPVAAVREMMAAYDRVYPEVRRMSNRWQRQARETGLVHLSVTGRRLPLDRKRMFAVVNYACQSAARDVLGQSLLFLEEKGLLDNLRLPIHDEVLASVPRAEASDYAREIERCMTFDLAGVPIVAEAQVGGRSWGSLYGDAA